ncbi:hypothetical protein FHS95_002994 [Sphingomonas naasensis]|uniref:Uncharacterized protein n=1 Tax=Sphingomonas naasensis TaxID=1344951 RepID=A0A4S1WA21_9SPHN|nr:hypothetical protein [Sphingomonas naasensis]NIJ21291.1 hypothetical protein [Sphingomonas naasensis]TGX38725.1 hypothetical protein E5A74_18005 [Sphingomonas naasensis]
MRRRWRIVLIATGAVAALACLNRDVLLFAVAVSASETRPALLADAQWNSPDSARDFRRRFHAGVAESELTRWLQDHGFALDPVARKAGRKVESLPCNARIAIDWSVDPGGRLVSTNANVAEASCL